MAKFMPNITESPVSIAGVVGRVLLWTFLLVILVQKVVPLVPYSWNFMYMSFFSLFSLIKQRPFIYIVFNFIIIFILIYSSSFTLKLNNLLQKLHRTSSHNISSLISQTSRKLSLSWDDDAWWHKIVNSEGTEHFPALDELSPSYEKNKEEEEEEMVSFPPRGVEKRQKVKDEVAEVQNRDDDYVVEESAVEEGENDTLDDTWRAIMAAKNNGGPYLKKSGTWTSGDRGGGGDGGAVEKKGKGRLARCKAELKKWRTFSREVVQEKDYYRVGGGSGGGGGGGWKKKEVALTYHDELKKRADAFIARFTNDMRLQRLESDQRFLEIANRGL